MVGSYAMPGWLERLKTDYFARRISHHDLDEIYDAAAKAAIKDQEIAGLDIITDGEPRRDNMVDYFLERLAGRPDRPFFEEVLLRFLRQFGAGQASDGFARTGAGFPVPPAPSRIGRPRSASPGRTA